MNFLLSVGIATVWVVVWVLEGRIAELARRVSVLEELLGLEDEGAPERARECLEEVRAEKPWESKR